VKLAFLCNIFTRTHAFNGRSIIDIMYKLTIVDNCELEIPRGLKSRDIIHPVYAVTPASMNRENEVSFFIKRET
jgi:hypothetical protein